MSAVFESISVSILSKKSNFFPSHSVYQSVSLLVCRAVVLSVCRSLGLSVCRSVGRPFCQFIGLLVCQSSQPLFNLYFGTLFNIVQRLSGSPTTWQVAGSSPARNILPFLWFIRVSGDPEQRIVPNSANSLKYCEQWRTVANSGEQWRIVTNSCQQSPLQI